MQEAAPQVETNTAPVQEYADNSLNNNTDMYNEPATPADNAGIEPYNPDTVNNNLDTADNNINQQTETVQTAQTEPYTPDTPAAEPAVNNIPQVEEQPVIEEPAPVYNRPKDVYILANSLNVRAIPSLESARIAAAKVGQKYEYVSENEDWVQIRLSPTLTGWVFKQYVSISERP